MKTLSLLQPWASLVIKGLKQIETRSWRTPYRGPILIHASRGKPTKEVRAIFEKIPEFMAAALRFGWAWDELPYGKILGAVEVVGTNPTEIFKGYYNKVKAPGIANIDSSLTEAERVISRFIDSPNTEEQYGDYGPKRQGWVLRNPVEFGKIIEGHFITDYIPAAGNLSIWDYEIPLPHTGYLPQAWQKYAA